MPARPEPPFRSLPRRAGQQGAAPLVRSVPEVYLVRYEDMTTHGYVVRSLADDGVLEVPKSFAAVEPFPLTNGQRARGARLLRWSGYALLGAGLSGLGGVLLGFLVVLATLVQLARFSLRVRRWRRGHQRTSAPSPLPAVAGAERLRLLGALGQGLLAVVVGSLLVLLLAWHLG